MFLQREVGVLRHRGRVSVHQAIKPVASLHAVLTNRAGMKAVEHLKHVLNLIGLVAAAPACLDVLAQTVVIDGEVTVGLFSAVLGTGKEVGSTAFLANGAVLLRQDVAHLYYRELQVGFIVSRAEAQPKPRLRRTYLMVKCVWASMRQSRR